MNVKLLRWAVVALLGIGALAFIAVGANGPEDPSLRAAEGQVAPNRANRTPFGNFGEVGFRIEGAAAQATAARCALLAETAAQQSQGLMTRTDLGGYDGMLFDFKADTTTTFWMKDTPLPLSIAFFDGTGRLVSTTNMAPCVNQPSCPTYSATGPYRWALEVPQGSLAGLGIGPGTRLVTTGPCT
jgi:uncharacterized membrane protein (UPF0127 family)